MRFREVLKDADRPMSSREICLAILPPDFDLGDKRRVYQVTDRVRKKVLALGMQDDVFRAFDSPQLIES